ncbi:MAG: hypothetical protein K2Q01_09180, partial [Rickettsiales bacterium]|nr:hypothetical protein [Rickettsiales bacterium]
AVDAGPLLVQDTMVPQEALGSMIAFYAYVYRQFPEKIVEAVGLMTQGRFMPQGYGENSHPRPLPGCKTLAEFRRKGGVIVRVRDLALARALLEA